MINKKIIIKGKIDENYIIILPKNLFPVIFTIIKVPNDFKILNKPINNGCIVIPKNPKNP